MTKFYYVPKWIRVRDLEPKIEKQLVAVKISKENEEKMSIILKMMKKTFFKQFDIKIKFQFNDGVEYLLNLIDLTTLQIDIEILKEIIESMNPNIKLKRNKVSKENNIKISYLIDIMKIKHYREFNSIANFTFDEGIKYLLNLIDFDNLQIDINILEKLV